MNAPTITTEEGTRITEHAIKPELYGAMKYRCIGPYRGDRIVAVAGDPTNRNVFYFGSTGE